MSLLGIAPGYIILAMLLLISGISSTLFHVPTPVMVKHLSGKRVGKGMSFYMVGGEGARTLGPIIITAAVSYWGLEGMYKLIPFGWITSAILFFKLKNVKISTAVQKKYDVEEGYWHIFHKFLPVFVSIAGITLCLGGIKAALTLYLPTFLIDEKGTSLWLANSSLAVLQLSGATGALLGGTLSDKFGRREILSVAAILSPLLMLGFVFAPDLLLFPLLALTGFFLFIPTPVMLAVIHEQDTKHLAFMNGIFMTLNFFFSASMVLLVGFLSDKIGMEKTYMIAPLFAFGAIIFARMVPKKVRTGE
jgi:FSR family fosmidomycin resistance protein-like MFS transporter